MMIKQSGTDILWRVALAVMILIWWSGDVLTAQESDKEPAPRISCSAPKGRQVDTDTYAVTNLEYIDVYVTLSNPERLKLRKPSMKNWAPADSPDAKAPPTLSIDAKRIVGSNREAVEIEAGARGGSGRYVGTFDATEHLWLKIPITRAERLVAIKEYTDTLLTEPEHAESREEGRGWMGLAFLLGNYTQNQVGSFEVVVTYTSYGQDYWQGKVSCSPIRLEIENRGNFFDQAPEQGTAGQGEEK